MPPAESSSTDEAFYRRFILPEEDRRTNPRANQWAGGFRWFRSENVVCLEKYRAAADRAKGCHLRVVP